jgi:hypothetical protein
MAENIRIRMRDQLAVSLWDIVDALAEVGISTERPHEASVDTDLVLWEALIWRAADRLADPNGPASRAWSKTLGVEAAARAWSRAAGALTLYTQMPTPCREDTFDLLFAPVSSNLAKWRAGVSWSVKG